MYLNGKQIETPKISDLECELLKKLVSEEFGDSSNMGIVSTRNDESCEIGGYERVHLIKWAGSQQQLGALITSLQSKSIIDTEDNQDGYGVGLWFDCAALAEIIDSHNKK
jgi:hypothetical protein